MTILSGDSLRCLLVDIGGISRELSTKDNEGSFAIDFAPARRFSSSRFLFSPQYGGGP